MPPKKNKNNKNVIVTRKTRSTKSVTPENQGVQLQGNSLKNTKKREDNPMGVNIVVNTVVNTLWHKNGVSSKERPEKPAAAEIKNSISKSNNKPGEKKDKTKKTTKEDDVKVKIPRKSKVPQERNLRKRNHAESTAEEPDEACSKFQKFQNHQETQVTPSMIDNDEELSTINSQHSNDKASDAILKNKTYYKHEFDLLQVQLKSEIQSNEIANNNNRKNPTGERSNRKTNLQSDDIIILSSDDEFCTEKPTH